MCFYTFVGTSQLSGGKGGCHYFQLLSIRIVLIPEVRKDVACVSVVA